MKARILASIAKPPVIPSSFDSAYIYLPFTEDKLEKKGNMGVSVNVVGNLEVGGLRSLTTEATTIITLPSFNAYSQDWTIECYVTLSSNSYNNSIWSWGEVYGTGWVLSDSGTSLLYCNENDGIRNVPYATNVKRHIAVTYTAATRKFKVYINGILYVYTYSGTVFNDGFINVSPSTITASTTLHLGYPGYPTWKNNLIQHFAFTKAIKYTANFTPPAITL
jgi:hypothetical protein